MTADFVQNDNQQLFTAVNTERDRNFLIRMSHEEREFLGAEAGKRGVSATNLLRECIRRCLIEEHHEPKITESPQTTPPSPPQDPGPTR